ncbi:MAG TPA: MFS transporter [Acidimicrobiales bacterium]|nr:MFS transporter [Acidimicrobiales bacterium]
MTATFSPLKARAFRWLEGTAVFASTGVWMMTLVSGFIMARLTTSPILVTMAAATSPLAGIFAVLLSGAAADSRDRRSILLLAKLLLVTSAAFLAVISAAGWLSPGTLLIGLAAMGLANGASSPVWWTTVTSLVPAEAVPVALSIDSFQWNIGQVAGPVLGGTVLRSAGGAVFFGLCAAVIVPLVGFLFFWRGRQDLRLSTPGGTATESLLGSMSAGWRYFSNTPGLRAIAARTFLFVTPAVALGALLPLYAAKYLHATAFGYGLLLALAGVGALLASLMLPHLQGRLHLDAIVAAATLADALALVALVLWPNRWSAVPVLVVAGGSFVCAVVAFIIAARQVTPDWVQTRALSLFYVVLQSPSVVGGIGFGLIDTFLSLRITLLIAACAFVPGVLLIPRFGLPVVARSSLELFARPSVDTGAHISPGDGPVLVMFQYRINVKDVDDFLQAMARLRVVRRRLGATRWGVFQDAAEPGTFVETFLLSSWQEYLQQRGHYSIADREVEARAFAFNAGGQEPPIQRFVHPETVEAARARSEWRREMLRLLKIPRE